METLAIVGVLIAILSVIGLIIKNCVSTRVTNED
jgi:hypothetical protein